MSFCEMPKCGKILQLWDCMGYCLGFICTIHCWHSA